jgi:hypothetical protein
MSSSALFLASSSGVKPLRILHETDNITEAMEHVVYVPTGFFFSYQAWRSNVSGVVKAPLPFFWGVAKA